MRLAWLTMGVVLLAMAACGDSGANSAVAQDLQVSPQNSTILLGYNRLGIALTDGANKAVLNATATVDIPTAAGIETKPLPFIGHEYHDIPVYLGVVSFPATGATVITVHAVYADGTHHDGVAHVTVTTQSNELPIKFKVPATTTQRILADVHGDVSQIDSGVPPDSWHTETIAQGLAEHKPMVLYFGQPGHCTSRTCGPTVTLLTELQQSVGAAFLFEHIEVKDPAGGGAFNPAYVAFGLSSEPWVYFINSDGLVTDRYEGPVGLDQLKLSASGTLAGKVPAVDLTGS